MISVEGGKSKEPAIRRLYKRNYAEAFLAFS
jgi:hypothetical protein